MPSDISAAIPNFEGRKAGAWTFAAIFSLESFVRALNASVIPIQAYELLGSSRNVSVLSTGVALAVLITTLMLPLAFGHMRRRWAYSLGITCSLAAALFLASHTITGQVAGYYFRQTGASIMNVALSLYILDHINRADYARSEPIRLSSSTISWTLGPMLGVWLYQEYGYWAPQIAVMAAAVTLATVFWILRLADPVTLPQGNLTNFNPLANAWYFFSQPRLRLAWFIAFMRSVFWSGLFTYGPLLMIESGLSKASAGIVVSASQIILPSALVFGWVAIRTGVRPVITACFVSMALATIAAGISGGDTPYWTIAFLLIGALAASGLDGVGAIPYMRAVRPRDRSRMTSVYRTFLESSEIIPGFIFSLVLSFAPTSAVFIVISFAALVMAFVAWKFLPKSL
ncbi:MAG: MFS transporter [Proteobacteria bacterium]|nr:MFS transporter [Pseudomonadota bacterium]